MANVEKRSANKTVDNDATTGYEADLWRMADTLRGEEDTG